MFKTRIKRVNEDKSYIMIALISFIVIASIIGTIHTLDLKSINRDLLMFNKAKPLKIQSNDEASRNKQYYTIIPSNNLPNQKYLSLNKQLSVPVTDKDNIDVLKTYAIKTKMYHSTEEKPYIWSFTLNSLQSNSGINHGKFEIVNRIDPKLNMQDITNSMSYLVLTKSNDNLIDYNDLINHKIPKELFTTEFNLNDQLAELESIWYLYNNIGFLKDEQKKIWLKYHGPRGINFRSYNEQDRQFKLKIDERYQLINEQLQKTILKLTGINKSNIGNIRNEMNFVLNTILQQRGQELHINPLITSNIKKLQNLINPNTNDFNFNLDLNKYFDARDLLIDTWQKCIADSISELKASASGQEDYYWLFIKRTQSQKEGNAAEYIKRNYDDKFGEIIKDYDIEGKYRRYKSELRSIANYLLSLNPNLNSYFEETLRSGKFDFIKERASGISKVPVVGHIFEGVTGYHFTRDDQFTQEIMTSWKDLCTLLQDTNHMDFFKSLIIGQDFIQNIIFPLISENIYKTRFNKYSKIQTKNGTDPFQLTHEQKEESRRKCKLGDPRGCIDYIGDRIGRIVLVPQEIIIQGNNLMAAYTLGAWYKTPAGAAILAYGLSHMQYITSGIAAVFGQYIKYTLTLDPKGFWYTTKKTANGIGWFFGTKIPQLFSYMFGYSADNIYYRPSINTNYFTFINPMDQQFENTQNKINTWLQ